MTEKITEEEMFYVRDYFLNAEGFFPDALISVDKDFDNIIEYLNENYTNEELYEKCEKIMEKVETGQVKQEEMEKTEIDLTLLFKAIKEKEKVKKLIKTPTAQKHI